MLHRYENSSTRLWDKIFKDMQTQINSDNSKVPKYFISTLVLFLQGFSIACYAEPCISYGRVVHPFVCPSVTRWHWVKTMQARITKSSPTDSPRTLVFGLKRSSRNSKGFNPRGGIKWEWGRKNFQPISHRILETVQDRTKVTIND